MLNYYCYLYYYFSYEMLTLENNYFMPRSRLYETIIQINLITLLSFNSSLNNVYDITNI